ncbi:questin oxidase family protein [Micromonospora sp. WMMD1102]|uniref:questin oxidase family protein n=1 Tax=Micromonospora sp. WMMD1102 TaxID=3016105 RepID=UPI002414F1C2|nr:questin oxidase family protein [Micromonospora sp. WMMD1102]MDG4786200.1 questin oxidase family protein [Micromonospora sp. WMMD1102]
MSDSVVDEAYQRLQSTGPERDGWLSNHAPMAAEALARHGYGTRVHRWLDRYADRLTERPRGIAPIPVAEWRDPLGDPTRTGDWLDYFARELADEPWSAVLARWWPRLLPGIAAGATHGVIRVGHAVRALRDAETPPRIAELGAALGYWAARWQPLAPPGAARYPATDPRTALDRVPRVPDQRFGIRARLAQLAGATGWPEAAGAVPGDPGTAVPTRLAAIVDAAVVRYDSHGYASPVMLVHAATAPNAVLRTLPALPTELWRPSLAAAWAATAAVTAAYAPAEPRPLPDPHPDLRFDEAWNRAVDSGDEHAIKFVDTAVETHDRIGDPTLPARVADAIRPLTGE